jgi:hypothetical protein
MQTFNNLYVIIARDVTTDAVDNMNSIIKIIDKFSFDIDSTEFATKKIEVGSKPIGLPAAYYVATSWIFKEKLKKETFLIFKINIFDPEGRKLEGGPEQENLIPAGIDRFNMNFNIQGLPVTTEGRYRMEAEILSKDYKSLAKGEYPFSIEFIRKPQKNE